MLLLGREQFLYNGQTYTVQANPFIQKITQEFFLVTTLKITRTELKEYDSDGLDVLSYLAMAINEIKQDEQRKLEAKTRHSNRRR